MSYCSMAAIFTGMPSSTVVRCLGRVDGLVEVASGIPKDVDR